MNSAIIFGSSFTPQNSSGLWHPTALLYPVPTGSINTKSASLNGDLLLSTILKGGEPSSSALLGTFTIFGPNTPTWSHNDADPGPPLKLNMIGLFLLSSTIYSV